MDLDEIRRKTIPVNQYISNLKEPFRQNFLTGKQTYQPNVEALKRLKAVASEYLVIVFSAEWCKDCTAIISALALVSEITGLEVRVFGGLKKDPFDPNRRWRIPPSPPEVEQFKVDKIPTIIVADVEGRETGRIIEKPSLMLTIEEELCKIIRQQQHGRRYTYQKACSYFNH